MNSSYVTSILLRDGSTHAKRIEADDGKAAIAELTRLTQVTQGDVVEAQAIPVAEVGL